MASQRFSASSGRTPRGRPPFVVILGAIASILIVFVVIRLAWGEDLPDPPPPPDLEGTTEQTDPPIEVPATGPSAAPGPRADAPEEGLSPQLAKIQRWGLPIYCGGGNEPIVALTFDDGPGPFTAKTLQYLKQQRIPATFFVVGKLFTTSTNEKLARQETRQGEVANHSFSHFGLAGESTSTLVAEIDRPQRTIEKVTDMSPLFFRPPWGSHDAASDRHVAGLGMITVIWSLESRDSQTGTNAEEIVEAIDAGLSAGDIVLLHENRGTTQAALPQIIEIMRERGLTAVTLSELLTRDPPTRKQVKNADCS